MAIITNDNYHLRAPKPMDDRGGYATGATWNFYSTIADFLANSPYRYPSMTVPFIIDGEQVEYWFFGGTEDSDFVLKISPTDLSNYVTIDTDQIITGAKTFENTITLGFPSTNEVGYLDVYNGLDVSSESGGDLWRSQYTRGYVSYSLNGSISQSISSDLFGATSNSNITIPKNKSGIIALTTDIPSVTGFEVLTNKQNSLAVDATNNKYPTVTAVNVGLSTKQNLLGFTPENVVNKVSDLSSPSATTYINTLGLSNVLDGKVNTSVPITGGYGVTVGGDLTSAISITLNTSTIDGRYLRKDQDDDNGANTITLGALISGTATINGDLTLPSLAVGTSNDILVVDSLGVVQKKELTISGDFGVADAAGINQFDVALGSDLLFEGANDTTVTFDPVTKKITISSVPGSGGGGAVVSYNSRTGAVVPISGDYNTGMVPEMTNLYFTEPRVRSSVLTGLSASNTAILATDSVIQAFGKSQGQLNNKVNTSRELTIAGTAGRLIVSGAETQNLTTNPSWTFDLSTIGTAGTYKSVTVDAYGRVASGTNPTTLGGFGITDAYTKAESDNLYPLKDGTGATGTWGVNISGSSANSAQWAGINFSGAVPTPVNFLTLADGSNAGYSSISQVQTALGIPSGGVNLQTVTDVGNSTTNSITSSGGFAASNVTVSNLFTYDSNGGIIGTNSAHPLSIRAYGLEIAKVTNAGINVNGYVKSTSPSSNMFGFRYEANPEIQIYQNNNNWGFYNTVTSKQDLSIDNTTGLATFASDLDINGTTIKLGGARRFAKIGGMNWDFMGTEGWGVITPGGETGVMTVDNSGNLALSGNITASRLVGSADKWANIGYGGVVSTGGISHIFGYDSVTSGDAKIMTIADFKAQLGIPSSINLQTVTDGGNSTTQPIIASKFIPTVGGSLTSGQAAIFNSSTSGLFLSLPEGSTNDFMMMNVNGEEIMKVGAGDNTVQIGGTLQASLLKSATAPTQPTEVVRLSDLGNYVNTTGNQTGIAGNKAWTGNQSFSSGTGIVEILSATGTVRSFTSNKYVGIANGDNLFFFNQSTGFSTTVRGTSTGIVNINFPNASGTLALREDRQTGWAQYTDNVYTSGSPLVINSGTTATLTNNAATSITTQLPDGVAILFDPLTSKIMPALNGDSYLINVRFTAESSSNTGLADVHLDIVGAVGALPRQTISLRKGAGNAQQVNVIFDVYSASAFVTNGGLINLTSVDGNTSIYDISYKVTRVHKAR